MPEAALLASTDETEAEMGEAILTVNSGLPTPTAMYGMQAEKIKKTQKPIVPQSLLNALLSDSVNALLFWDAQHRQASIGTSNTSQVEKSAEYLAYETQLKSCSGLRSRL